jgi:uncharacterized protein (TIGR02145 family)
VVIFSTPVRDQTREIDPSPSQIRNGTAVNRFWLLAASLALTSLSCSANEPVPWSAGVTYDTLRDARDSKTYRTVKIGSQNWMAQNLAVVVDGSWCYGNRNEACDETGRLYSRAQAEHACPAGWHLPAGPEWDTLFHSVGWAYAMDKLRSSSGWDYQKGFHPLWILAKWIRPISGGAADPVLGILGQDAYGFRVLPSGIRTSPDGVGEQALKLVKVQNFADKQEFGLEGTQAYFWASTSYDASLPSARDVFSGIAVVSRQPAFDSYGFSVRCVEDSMH